MDSSKIPKVIAILGWSRPLGVPLVRGLATTPTGGLRRTGPYTTSYRTTPPHHPGITWSCYRAYSTTPPVPASGGGGGGSLEVTEAAGRRLVELVGSGGGGGGRFLRVAVEGGGCSGFQYKFTLEDHRNPDDKEFCHPSFPGGVVVVDGGSLEYLEGATIDWAQELIRSSFRVLKNPKADHGCSCGASFTIKLD